MSVDKDTVREVAHLARLQIAEPSLDSYAVEMASVLKLAEQMQAVDTDAVEAMAHPLHAVQRLRVDEVTETDQRQQFQANAPATQEGLYLVPQVIE